jgi:hypothetical protein
MTFGTGLMTNACQGHPIQKGAALLCQIILDDLGGHIHPQLSRR